MTKSFVRIENVLIRTNSAKYRDRQYTQDQIICLLFQMALNSLKILEMDLIFLFKTFSQQEVETKTHCSDLEGWFPPPYLNENRDKEIMFFLVNIWSFVWQNIAVLIQFR